MSVATRCSFSKPCRIVQKLDRRLTRLEVCQYRHEGDIVAVVVVVVITIIIIIINTFLLFYEPYVRNGLITDVDVNIVA
jgi:hypothetical protein